MKIINKKDFAIKISGNHYFACDYVFSNVYGDEVFFEDDGGAMPLSDPEPDMFALDENSENNLLDTLPETPLDMISTLPDCTKKIEYMTEGSVLEEGDEGIYIRYGNDSAPMCIHIRRDGSVTLSNDDTDVAEIVFEKGKRNFIAIPESLIYGNGEGGGDTADSEEQSPIHLCVDTCEIENNMSAGGGSLSVSYSIEVNGMLAEVTDFTLTANTFGNDNKI